MAYTEAEARNLVILSARRLVDAGLTARTWGNLSARISDEQFVITPSGLGYDIMEPEDLVVVNISDLSYEGNRKPSSEKGIHADVAAGLSLGEYSALVQAEALDFADAVRIVRKRGQFMQEAVPVGEGSMAAVLGMDSDKIVEICRGVEAECGEAVQAVNFNCPGQVVIAGAVGAVDKALVALKEAGAKRAVLLPVSAPFHSTLLQPASERLAEVFKTITFHDAKIPVMANVNAEEVTKGEVIKESLIRQAAMPVLWETGVRKMIAGGVDTFVEVGPGKVLCGFNKKIDKSVTSLNVEDEASLAKTLAYFQEVR